MAIVTVKGEPNGGREGWLTLRQIREAGYISPEQLAKGEPPDVGDVGGKVVDFCRKMEIAIMETAFAKDERLEGLPFGPKFYDEFNQNRRLPGPCVRVYRPASGPCEYACGFASQRRSADENG